MALRRFSVLCFFFLPFLLTGCGDTADTRPSDSSSITDDAYLTSDLWDDGQAEVAFYQVRRSQDQYGQPNEQRFVAGTYLVKHRFSPQEMTKKTDGTGTSSFKYALFYELESGSYQYKRNWVVNARQKDLRPYKQSFTSFDWCSNLYRETAFPLNGAVEVRKRSDDYGNRRTSFTGKPQSYPPAQLPLLVRGLNFSRADTLHFDVAVADSAEHVSARAIIEGRDSIETDAGRFDTERITIRYETPVPSMVGEVTDESETYWRSTGPRRLLIRLAAESGRYQMDLIEQVRSPYWKENVWTRLSRVRDRP